MDGRQYENVWGRAYGLDRRGRHKTVSSAVDAALKDLLAVRDPFYLSVADRWDELFPGMPAKPGRYEDGKVFLYVRSAPMLFTMRPKLRMIRNRLLQLPGAPKGMEVRLEIHGEARR